LPPTESIPAGAWIFMGAFVLIALAIYGEQVRRIVVDGGKVRVADFALSELLMSIVFAGFFTMMTINAFQRAGAEKGTVGIDVVLPSSLLFVLFSGAILGFLKYGRRLNPGHLFGVDQTTPLATLGWATGLLFAALPLAGAANAVTVFLLKNQVTPQPLVKLFSEVARNGDYLAVAKILFAGVIVAPICEEFLFRGFFYGVWKRYLGPFGAGFLACALFAAFHASVPALAGLFVLAICLNLAYERTGSLLVPIGMHALFNLVNLVVLFGQAVHTAPLP
jgi:membrane protease YdiL (CAAX protease family)